MVGRVGFEPTMGFLRQIMSLLPATNTASGPPQFHCNRAPAGAARLVRQAGRWSPRRCGTTTIVRTALRSTSDQARPVVAGHSAQYSACASSADARRRGAQGPSIRLCRLPCPSLTRRTTTSSSDTWQRSISRDSATSDAALMQNEPSSYEHGSLTMRQASGCSSSVGGSQTGIWASFSAQTQTEMQRARRANPASPSAST